MVDTNGAGDSLAVGFLSSFFLENKSFENSILNGQTLARHVCTIKASTSNMISKEIKNLIKR